MTEPNDPNAVAAAVKESLRGDYTDAGMEDAFFRWPAIERAIHAACTRSPVAGKASELADESWKSLDQCEGPEEIALYWRLQAERARTQLAALSRPPVITEEAVEAVADLHTHRTAWRNAIIVARDWGADNCEDPDAERSYWNHELRAFDRAFAALSASPVAAEEKVRHVAAILEEWDMKDPPDAFTGHAYEDIARDILARTSPPPGADRNAVLTADESLTIRRIQVVAGAHCLPATRDAHQTDLRNILALVERLTHSPPVAGDGGEAMDHGNIGWGGEAGRGCI